MMIERGEKFTTFPVESWYDCGKPETLLETNRDLLDRTTSVPEIEGVVINAPVSIDPTARITNAIIGPHATIGRDAVVRDSIVRDSIVGEEALIEGAVLSGSIIGNSAQVHGDARELNIGAHSEIQIG
jgi:glucose-1-phosphate thymidylyltransferase